MCFSPKIHTAPDEKLPFQHQLYGLGCIKIKKKKKDHAPRTSEMKILYRTVYIELEQGKSQCGNYINATTKKINTKYRRIHGNRHPKSGHKRKLYVLYFKKYS